MGAFLCIQLLFFITKHEHRAPVEAWIKDQVIFFFESVQFQWAFAHDTHRFLFVGSEPSNGKRSIRNVFLLDLLSKQTPKEIESH